MTMRATENGDTIQKQDHFRIQGRSLAFIDSDNNSDEYYDYDFTIQKGLALSRLQGRHGRAPPMTCDAESL